VSSLARWTYTSALTVWPSPSYDEYGQPAYADPYLLLGSWEAGGDTRTDDTGQEFVPMSTYYFEAEDESADIPKRDWFIKRGNHIAVASPPSDAEKIKKVEGWDMSAFGVEIPDWRIST